LSRFAKRLPGKRRFRDHTRVCGSGSMFCKLARNAIVRF
jgi:hypothetical protein